MERTAKHSKVFALKCTQRRSVDPSKGAEAYVCIMILISSGPLYKMLWRLGNSYVDLLQVCILSLVSFPAVMTVFVFSEQGSGN